jgi:hypothetical protein
MRVNFNPGGFNLGDITFKYNSSGTIRLAGLEQGLRIYPNPAGRRLMIQSRRPDFTWQITDLNGSVIMEGKSDGVLAEVNAGWLQPGSYLVITRNGNGERHTGRFIRLPE